MTIIKLFDGDLGSEQMLIRADLSQAAAPIEVDYQTGDGYEPTQYQTADARHTVKGLIALGYILGARAVEVPIDSFNCEIEEIG